MLVSNKWRNLETKLNIEFFKIANRFLYYLQ